MESRWPFSNVRIWTRIVRNITDIRTLLFSPEINSEFTLSTLMDFHENEYQLLGFIELTGSELCNVPEGLLGE
jgi:hypothetical protein